MRSLTKRLDAVLALTDIAGHAKAVLLYVTYRDSGNGCFSSLSTIATELGIARRTVIRALDRLVEQGYIVKTKRERSQSNIYHQVVSQSHHLPKLQVVSERHQVVSESHLGGVRESPKQEINRKLTESNSSPLKRTQALFEEEHGRAPYTMTEFFQWAERG